jgi:DNA helicase HerA-like ATPase
MLLTEQIKSLALVDIFLESKKKEYFLGRPFYLDYDKAYLLIADAWKKKVGGIPQGTFLLAFYENEEDVAETLLLRALKPTKLPTDNDVVSSMVEYYKDNLNTSGKESQLDEFTRYEFSFSGLECRILGTFYKDKNDKTLFGADVENFYSAHNYSVYKPQGKVLEFISNLRDGDSIPGSDTDIRIGKVRYSSSYRFQENMEDVPVYVNPKDFLGKRTALFGMTRTGKSNTVKKIIQSTVEISKKVPENLFDDYVKIENLLEPYDSNGIPKQSVGQIIFDINGEYANANLQDDGTAIFELYKEDVIRYSVLEKTGFNIMKVNFYKDLLSGFELIKSHLINDITDYVKSFTSIDLSEPEDKDDESSVTRYGRRKAAYLCCLAQAGFKIPDKFIIKFDGNKDLNDIGGCSPDKGISLNDAINWFSNIWNVYEKESFFENYKKRKKHEWADEDLKSILIFLTRKQKPGGKANISGYRKLNRLKGFHTNSVSESFETDIIKALRKGKIIIVDLSQGDPEVQRLYSERICRKIFSEAMDNFIKNKPNNFVQFYFEEAHNLFPKKDDKDLSQVYNRVAKEGAKFNLGLIYATQEVSSISGNILKNTQNWFIAHLNNDDELKEVKKYYDFGDFAESLIRFSASSDKGFVRMKTYSNPFVVPVQIDRFLAK